MKFVLFYDLQIAKERKTKLFQRSIYFKKNLKSENSQYFIANSSFFGFLEEPYTIKGLHTQKLYFYFHLPREKSVLIG
jgi:hypothetical protein